MKKYTAKKYYDISEIHPPQINKFNVYEDDDITKILYARGLRIYTEIIDYDIFTNLEILEICNDERERQYMNDEILDLPSSLKVLIIYRKDIWFKKNISIICPNLQILKIDKYKSFYYDPLLSLKIYESHDFLSAWFLSYFYPNIEKIICKEIIINTSNIECIMTSLRFLNCYTLNLDESNFIFPSVIKINCNEIIGIDYMAKIFPNLEIFTCHCIKEPIHYLPPLLKIFRVTHYNNINQSIGNIMKTCNNLDELKFTIFGGLEIDYIPPSLKKLFITIYKKDIDSNLIKITASLCNLKELRIELEEH